jgi:predicted DNA-binding transcriptional regulator AlpA
LPEAAVTVAAAGEATSLAKRRTLANVGERRKHDIVALANPQAEERYLSVQDVARRYAVSIQIIWRHTKHNPHFPKPIKILNGSTRWRMSDVLAFEISRQEKQEKI